MHEVNFKISKLEISAKISTLPLIIFFILFLVLISFFILNTCLPYYEEISTQQDITNDILELKQSQLQINEDIKVIRELLDYLFGPKDIVEPSSNVRTISGLTVRQVNEILKGTPAEGEGIHVIRAERKYGTNAWVILSMSAHESGYWRSNLAKTRNNYFGWKAYTNSSGSAMYFDNFEDCVMHVSEKISKNYLTKGGVYYVEPTLLGMSVKYAADKDWANKVLDVKKKLEKKLWEEF